MSSDPDAPPEDDEYDDYDDSSEDESWTREAEPTRLEPPDNTYQNKAITTGKPNKMTADT